jgi:hypothetical protein
MTFSRVFRIVGELFKLQINIGETSVRRILMEEGMSHIQYQVT